MPENDTDYISTRTGSAIDQAVGNANNALIANGKLNWGDTSIAYGNNSVALGYHCLAKKQNSFAVGTGIENNTAGQIVVGKFNVENNTSAVFVIGGGTSSSRKNVLTIDGSGDLRIIGDIYTGADNGGNNGTKLANWVAEDDGNGNVTIT